MDKKNSESQKKEEKNDTGKSNLQKQCEEYKNDLQRLAAEFDNYKKRIERETQVSRQLGREDVLLELISLSDEFSEALKHSSSDKDTMQGLRMLAKKLDSTIFSFGVEEVKCNGEADPNVHEVMLQVQGKNKGEICDVLRKGYKIKNRLLRPAQVSVYSGESNGNDEKKKTDNKASDSSKNGESGEKKNGDEN